MMGMLQSRKTQSYTSRLPALFLSRNISIAFSPLKQVSMCIVYPGTFSNYIFNTSTLNGASSQINTFTRALLSVSDSPFSYNDIPVFVDVFFCCAISIIAVVVAAFYVSNSRLSIVLSGTTFTSFAFSIVCASRRLFALYYSSSVGEIPELTRFIVISPSSISSIVDAIYLCCCLPSCALFAS